METTIKSSFFSVKKLKYAIQLFYKPKKVFDEMKAGNGLGLVNIIVILLINTLITFIISKSAVGTSEIGALLPKELSEKQSTLTLFSVIMSVLSVIQFLFGVLIMTAIYKLLVMITSANVSFSKIFSITFLTQLPVILGKLVNFLAQGVSIENNISITSLGYTLKSLGIENTFILSLSSRFEIFSMLSFALTVMGIYCLSNSSKKIPTIFWAAWLVLALISSFLVSSYF